MVRPKHGQDRKDRGRDGREAEAEEHPRRRGAGVSQAPEDHGDHQGHARPRLRLPRHRGAARGRRGRDEEPGPVVMTCSCGGQLAQFQATDSRVKVEALPAICTQCHVLYIEGRPVLSLAQQLEREGKGVALYDRARLAGQTARQDLEAETGKRIEDYFARVYLKAYLDGFFRAVGFYKILVKEGRLTRLRRLWKGAQKGGNLSIF